MEDDMLVYQEEDVHTIPTSQEEISVAGKLRIIERRNSALVEWRCSEDDCNPDSDWAVVNTSAVTFTHHNTSDAVEISTPRRHVRPISVELIDLRSYKLSNTGSLVLIQRDGSTHPALQFPGKDASYFVEVLQRYVSVKQSEKDSSLFLLQDKKQAEQDAKLSALNLGPSTAAGSSSRRRRPRPRPTASSTGSSSHASPYSNSPSNSDVSRDVSVIPWATASRGVMGFLHNLKRDPYTTTLSTLSKFYDSILFEYEEGLPSEREADDANIFNSLNGFDDMEPGYQLVSLKGELAERSEVHRDGPLTQQEFCHYCDMEGRIIEPCQLKRRMFKGGLHPSLRSELWCCLLGHYSWNFTRSERVQHSRIKQKEYDALKLQWSTITPEQESRFTGFRDRKSLIEKDVNRTDRSHPFYEGENNPNVQMLHNILMSYVMYNFDLGYVQGMSDLLAPILYVTQNESTAFWCFVGYLETVKHNFDMDQGGMKEQLHGLQQLLAVVDPEFMSYLEAKESANLYFCFRWLLVRYKRELSYFDTLRLWEVLWTNEPCPNFHLLVAAAILDQERATIMENKFGFTEILKHINDTSQQLNLDKVLCTAEAIYHQLAASVTVPAPVLELIGLPVPPPRQEMTSPATEAKEEVCSSSTESSSVIHTASGVGGGDYVYYSRSRKSSPVENQDEDAPQSEEGRGLVGTVTNLLGNAVRHIAGDELTSELFSPMSSEMMFRDDFSDFP